MTWLENLQVDTRWKAGSTRAAVDSLGRLAGKDLAPFFEAYFWGTEMPD